MTSQDPNHKHPDLAAVGVTPIANKLGPAWISEAEVTAIRSRWRIEVEDLRIELADALEQLRVSECEKSAVSEAHIDTARKRSEALREVERLRAANASLLDLTADARAHSWRSTVDELRARLRLDDDETLEQEVTRLRGPQPGDDSSALRTVLRASLDAATRLAETDRPVEALEAVRLWLSVREIAARHGDLRES